MVSSIVLTGCKHVGVSNSNRIEVEGNVLNIEKDIPFVRYRFGSYGAEEIAYMKQMYEQFKWSTHLAEVTVGPNLVNELQLIESEMPNVAKFVYVDITDEMVSTHTIPAELLGYLQQAKGFKIDRLMFRDRSTTLDMVCTNLFISSLSKMLGFKKDTFGVCSSPLSFGELACLTAARARELMSLYGRTTDGALPTANHECMNCCGCARYMVIDKDLAAPVGKSGGNKGKSDGSGESKSKPKKKKSGLVVNADMFSL